MKVSDKVVQSLRSLIEKIICRSGTVCPQNVNYVSS